MRLTGVQTLDASIQAVAPAERPELGSETRAASEETVMRSVVAEARVPGKSRAHVRLDPGGSYSIPDMLLADAPVPPTCKSPQELFHAFTGLLHTECIKMGLVYGIPSRFGQSITARFPLQIPIRFLWGAERCRRWSRRRTLHP